MTEFAARSLWKALFTIILLIGTACSTLANDVDIKKLVANIIDGQMVLLNKEKELKIWNCTISAENHGRKANPSQVTVKRLGDSILLRLPTGIMCMHQDSFFAILGSGKKGAWTLQNYRRNDIQTTWKDKTDDWYPALYPLEAARPGYTVLSIINDTTFKPIKARQLNDNMFELDYTLEIPDKQGGEKRKLEGTWTYSKSQNYTLIKSVGVVANTKSGQPVGSQFVRSFHDTSPDSKPEVIRLDYQEPNSKSILNSTFYTFDYTNAESVEPAEFTLEYYGITPPTDDVYEDHGFNWPLWGGLGVGCIMLSLLLSWIVRRRNRLKAGG